MKFNSLTWDSVERLAVERLAKVCRKFGYHVAGPYTDNEENNQLVDSLTWFCETWNSVKPDDSLRRNIIKQLVALLRKEGYEAIERSHFQSLRVMSHESDRAFEKLAREILDQGRSLMSPARLYTLWQALQNVANLPYATMEVGGYRGGTTAFIVRALDYLRAPTTAHYCIDPFTGHRGKDIQAYEVHTPGHFDDVAEEDVRRYLAPYPRVRVIKGYFEDIVDDLPETTYRFVHIDTDLYHPTLKALEYLAPLMVEGGIIVIDDYLAPKCPGVSRAVHEFLAQHAPSFMTLALAMEQILFIKRHRPNRQDSGMEGASAHQISN